MSKEIKIGDLVRFTDKMPGIVMNEENTLTIAAKSRPYFVAEVALGAYEDSCGYDYVVSDGKDRIICLKGDIELIKK